MITLHSIVVNVDAEGYYTFLSSADDTYEIFIDGELIHMTEGCEWASGHCGEHTYEVYLTVGEHVFAIYYEEVF